MKYVIDLKRIAMTEIKSYHFLTRKQIAKIIIWSLFDKRTFAVYADAVLNGKRAKEAYEDALKTKK